MMQSDHSSSNHSSSPTPDQKIKTDLTTLTEQINLCQSILAQCPTPSSIDANESLLSTIGFLEACVPRMVELIEAAATGALSEEIFEECLVVNDKLTNVLGDVEKEPKDRMPLTPAAVAPSTTTGMGTEPEIDLSMDNFNIVESSVASGGKSDVDPFSGGVDLLTPTPAAEEDDPFAILDRGDGKPAALTGAKVEEDEDFDAFFKDRTSASPGRKED
jgi:hypothetical protein